MKEEESSSIKECIENCRKCHKVCSDTIMECLSLGGAHAELNHITVLHDCLEICQTAYNFMIRNSDFSPDICNVCGEICQRCADECAKFDNPQMSNCTKVCKECADSCANVYRIHSGKFSEDQMKVIKGNQALI